MYYTEGWGQEVAVGQWLHLLVEGLGIPGRPETNVSCKQEAPMEHLDPKHHVRGAQVGLTLFRIAQKDQNRGRNAFIVQVR